MAGEAIFLNLKAAAPSSTAAAFRFPQPTFANEAARIVAVQQRCQTVPPAHLASVEIGQEPFVLRALQPREDRIDMAALADDPRLLIELFSQMGELAAFAVLRAARRDGAAGPDELIGLGRELEAQASAWQAATIVGEDANRRAHSTFRKAWLTSDPRLEVL